MVEETNQGFEIFQPKTGMDMFLRGYRTDGMDEACAFCNREVPTRGHHVVPRCKGGRDIASTCIRVRISSTRRGRITNCATRSTRSRRSSPILGSKSSFAGFTSSRKERFSGLDAIESEPASPTADFGRFVSPAISVPIAQRTERECPKLQVAGGIPAGDTTSRGCGSTVRIRLCQG